MRFNVFDKLRCNPLRPLTVVIATLLVATLLGCSAEREVRVLRLAHSLDTGHPVHKALLHMAERLRSISDNALQLRIYPSGQLGNERELIELLQIGSLDMTKVSASPLEGFVPVMKVFNVPYIFRDERHYWQVLEGPIGQDLLNAPIPARLKGLGYYDAGARSFYTVDHPVEAPEDLSGLKIRVQESATAMAMVQAMGGAPTPIAWGELYTALQQGVVDGAENNPPSFYLSGHYEVSRYFILDEHTAVPDLVLIGTFSWERLTVVERQWLTAAVQDSVAFQRRLWAEETERALAAVKAAGVTVIEPEKAAFKTRVSALHKQYKDTVVGRLIEQIQKVKP